MDSALRAHLDQHGGVLSTKAAARLGLSGNDLRALVRAGVLTRVARGAYVETKLLQGVSPEEHHRRRTIGIVVSRHGRLAACQQSAAVLHGLPVLDKELELVHTVHTREGQDGGRRFDTYRIYPFPGEDALTHKDGVPTVIPALAVLGTSLRAGLWSGQVATDAALRAGLTTKEELTSWLERMPRHPGIARARQVVNQADARSESAGESILRLLLADLGYIAIPQHKVKDASGKVIARVDFYLPEIDVVVEFDGMVKYGGKDGKDALEAERQRERRIRGLGHGVARVVWADLYNVTRIKNEIHAAYRSRTSTSRR
ncbi:type IV toxin-antitoxin system AbiEi family antitoxin domain-containing protein [Ornithinimicrobium avium]|uniref:AbiEi antitoxin N-terminal domain-containing protein n=1 Tax=Ornithinimicrobium avium TaxID=2283195 RepID=A0A345NKW2_9MICO|nr:type IV toxin-antitoxin system AbiEi family antitoxin domain-containing protein [Ornithinimicrobium avium]AXH95670.1 hypothetical protein DV701_05630 [Ornithinimicrobium avium]